MTATVVSAIMLVAIMRTTPFPVVRALDRFETIDKCETRLMEVKEYEKDKPKEQQLSNRLQCIEMQYVSDLDNDGPAPSKIIPEGKTVDTPHTAYPCRQPITHKAVACKEAFYVETE